MQNTLGSRTSGAAPGELERRTMAGESVPLLGFGCMRLPRDGTGRIDRAATDRLWSLYRERGGNYFDTAYMYHDGESEAVVGELLSKRPRDSYLLADKMPVWMAQTEDGVKRVFREQLERTKAGRFDFYLLQALGRANWETARRIRALEFLLERKKEGRIRHLGFSFHDAPEALDPILDAYDWEFAMIQLNHEDWTRYRSAEQYGKLDARGLDVAVMEPLRGGALARLDEPSRALLARTVPDASPASLALRWVAALPRVKLVNSGMNRERDLDENLHAFSPAVPLRDPERAALGAALDVYRRNQAVPCTACRYCVPCPAGVAIPDLISLWNAYKAEGNARQFLFRHESRIAPGSRASDCVRCGRCAARCPQKIDIPAVLAEIDAGRRAIEPENREPPPALRRGRPLC